MTTFTLALAALLAQSPVATPPQVPASRAPVVTDYAVGPQDVLSLVIHGFPEMSRIGAIVDPDGTIEYPHLGRIAVGGKTVRTIADEIKTKFLQKQYLTGNPTVVVTVTEFRSQIVTLVGEIRTPGAVTLKSNATLMQALSDAGSFTTQAGSYIEILRTRSDENSLNTESATHEQRIRITRDELYGGRGNFRLQNGDTILVPKAEVFSIHGQVRNPGQFTLQPDLTVIKAIILAGGYTDRAKKGTVEVTRMVNGKPATLTLKEHDLLMPGDVIKVHQRWV